LVRPAQSPLIGPSASFREDLLAVARAGIRHASASGALARALSDSSIRRFLSTPVHVIAVGKAAATMAATAAADSQLKLRALLAV